jgi:RNA polymerase sigma-70 factor (ECF subfamily)
MQLEHSSRSDEEIMKSIKSQNSRWKSLFSILINRHHNSLVTRCNCYLRNRADAEDAAQEAELRAFRAVRNFRQDSSFKTWLFAIADRQCHDLVRKRSKHLLNDHLRDLIEIHEKSRSGTRQPGANDDLVNQVLQRLPTNEREILKLRFYSDLPMKEMTIHLGLKLSATKMRLYRSLEHFAVLLQATDRDYVDVCHS